MNADTNHVPRTYVLAANGLESLVHNNRIPITTRRCCSKHIQPAGRNHANAERNITRVDQMDTHSLFSSETKDGLMLDGLMLPDHARRWPKSKLYSTLRSFSCTDLSALHT